LNFFVKIDAQVFKFDKLKSRGSSIVSKKSAIKNLNIE